MLQWTLGCTCLFQIWFPWCVCPGVGLLVFKGKLDCVFFCREPLITSWPMQRKPQILTLSDPSQTSMACLFPRGSLRTVLSILAKSQTFTNFLLVPLYFLRDLKWKIPLIFFDYDTYVYIIKSLPTLGSSWDSSSSLHPCGLRVIINRTSFCSPSFFQFGQYTILSPLLVSLHAIILAHLSSTLCSPVFIPAGEVALHS